MMNKTFAIIAILALTSCQTTNGRMQNGSMSKADVGIGLGALVGAVGGAFLGNGKGRTLAILAGAVGGGLIGNQIGTYLDEQDRRELAQSTEYALDTSTVGQGVSWANPDSGNGGQVVVETERAEVQRVALAVDAQANPEIIPLELINMPHRATTDVRIRRAPDPSSVVVGRLTQGEMVQGIGLTGNGWVLVSRSDNIAVGYVSPRYLKSVDKWTSQGSNIVRNEVLDDFESNCKTIVRDSEAVLACKTDRGWEVQAADASNAPAKAKVEQFEAQVPCKVITRSVTLKSGEMGEEKVTACKSADGWTIQEA